jgi:hypothetical protein
MIPNLPLSFWPDGWLWSVRCRILRALAAGPGPLYLDGLDWIDLLEDELSTRGFRFERTKTQ